MLSGCSFWCDSDSIQHVPAQRCPESNYDWWISPKAQRLQLALHKHCAHMKPFKHSLYSVTKPLLYWPLFIIKTSILALARSYLGSPSSASMRSVCIGRACVCVSVYINTAGRDRTSRRASVGDFIKNKSHLIIWIGTSFYCVSSGFGFGLALSIPCKNAGMLANSELGQ